MMLVADASQTIPCDVVPCVAAFEHATSSRDLVVSCRDARAAAVAAGWTLTPDGDARCPAHRNALDAEALAQ